MRAVSLSPFDPFASFDKEFFFSFAPTLLRTQSSGRTVVIAAVEGHVAGLFGLVDTLRPEAKGVVSELTRMGLEV